jgi:hypothetical protein
MGNRRSGYDSIAERVEVAGAKAAAFKLVAKAEGSHFTAPDGEWSLTAETTSELLRLVGRYLLTVEPEPRRRQTRQRRRPEGRLMRSSASHS